MGLEDLEQGLRAAVMEARRVVADAKHGGDVKPVVAQGGLPEQAQATDLNWVIWIKRPNVHEEVQWRLRVERVVVGRDLSGDECQIRIARCAARRDQDR